MKSYIKIIFIIFALFPLVQSCKKSDDYFISPNEPAKITLATALPVLEVGTFSSFEGDLARTSSILVQQNVGAQFQAQDPQVYNLLEDQFNNQWEQLYQNLKNAKNIEALAGNNNPHYLGISKILAAMNWGLLTDLWGDIPLSEALRIEEGILQPKFDSQESVLLAINGLLDQAIVELAKPSSDNIFLPEGNDLVFKGDPNLWTKTAYTLKARYLNRYSKKATYNTASILDALSKGISASSENCLAKHGVSNATNQWYAFENSRGYIVSSKSYIDSLLLRPADKRISYYFGLNDTGAYVGSPIDATSDGVNISRWGKYLVGSEGKSFPLVTFSEAKFIEAEVKARTSDDAGAATSLNDAIKASCSEVSEGAYDGADIATYTTADLSRVMYEKWLGMFGQVESYTDYRRTGYPMLTPNPNGLINTIPARFPVPQNERVANPNAPSPAITSPVWFAQ